VCSATCDAVNLAGSTSASFGMRKNYERYLLDFELHLAGEAGEGWEAGAAGEGMDVDSNVNGRGGGGQMAADDDDDDTPLALLHGVSSGSGSRLGLASAAVAAKEATATAAAVAAAARLSDVGPGRYLNIAATSSNSFLELIGEQSW